MESQTTELTRAQAKIDRQHAAQEVASVHDLAASALNRIVATTPSPQESASRASEAMERAAESAIQRCGIGRRFWGASLTDNPRTAAQGAALDALRSFCGTGAMDGEGVMLIGAPGLGKTHLLAAVLREMARQGKAIGYITVEGFFVGLRSCMGSAAKQSEAEYLHRLKEPQFLVLDDLQSIQDGESYQRRMLWLLLDMRYADCRATLTASNRTLAELRDMIDARTLRRFEAEVIAIARGNQ